MLSIQIRPWHIEVQSSSSTAHMSLSLRESAARRLEGGVCHVLQLTAQSVVIAFSARMATGEMVGVPAAMAAHPETTCRKFTSMLKSCSSERAEYTICLSKRRCINVAFMINESYCCCDLCHVTSTNIACSLLPLQVLLAGRLVHVRPAIDT